MLGNHRSAIKFRVPAILADPIVAHDNITGQGIIALVCEGLVIAYHHHPGGLIARDGVVKNVNIAIGHDHDAGAGWHGCNNIALWREVGSVIIDGLIAEEARGVSAHLRQVWQVENKDAARIMGRDIVEHIRIDRVLDLDPGDIEFRAAVLDDDVLGLTDIDARVRRTLHGHAVDQDIGRGHGIDTVGTVLFARATRPFDPDIDEADFVRPLGLDPITAAVFYGEVADRDAIRGNEQAFTRALLALEGQDRRFGACALDRHIIDIEREPVS